MHLVKASQYISAYCVQITFEDGTVKRVDLSPYLDGPVFEPLRDLAYFQQWTLHPELETLVWPNGADFAPDFLFQIGDVLALEETG